MPGKIVLIATLYFSILSSVLSARIIHVPGDSPTIQGGIDNTSSGDTVMVATGTYQEHNIDFLGKDIVVMSTDPEDSSVVAETVIDAERHGSVVYFRSGEELSSHLTGFTLTDGSADGGGGIRCDASSPTISKCRIEWNLALHPEKGGGGILCENDASPMIEDNLIRENEALFGGGGIVCLYSSPTLTGNRIVDNSAYHTGGITFYHSYAILSDNLIQGNHANWAGGINCNESSPAIVNNTIHDNHANYDAGGIFCWYSPSPQIQGNTITENGAENGAGIYCVESSPMIIGNTIRGNSVGYIGGGIYCNRDSSPVIANNLIAENGGQFWVPSAGGGIYCSSSFLTMSSNTIARNQAAEGGGIYCSSDSELVVVNTIFWDNSAEAGPAVWLSGGDTPSTLTIGYSDVQGGQSSIYLEEGAVLNWGSGMIDIDPLFRDAESDDYHLMAITCGDLMNSPCIDAGHPDSLDAILDCEHGLWWEYCDLGAYGGRGERPVSIEDDDSWGGGIVLPRGFELSQNFPNPFNPSTSIRYAIPESGDPVNVEMSIYNLRGRLVKVLVKEPQAAGRYIAHWDGTNQQGIVVSSGPYLYRFRAGDFTSTRKMIVVR